MIKIKDLKQLESKLNPNIWIPKLTEALTELTQIDYQNNLSIRKETFARILSIIKYLDLNYEDVVLFEPGAGDEIGGKINKTRCLHSSNIANFFLRSKQKMFEYYAFDNLMRPTEDSIEDINALNLFSFSEYISKISEVIHKDKLPIIFSSLVLGYIDKESDSVIENIGWPKFWLAKGLHIHQYLSKDLMTTANNINQIRKTYEPQEAEVQNDKHIRNLSDELFNTKMSEFISQRYDVDKTTYSKKIINTSDSNTISIWLNY